MSISFVTLWRQNRLPFLPPGDLPDPGIEHATTALIRRLDHLRPCTQLNLVTNPILLELCRGSKNTRLLRPWSLAYIPAAAAAKLLQSCPTLCDPIDGSPPGSPIPGILQARTLEWVAICFSNAWKWKVKVKSLSHARLLATPWTAAYQAPPSMGFSRQEYWSGLPLPSSAYIPSGW